MNTYLLLLQTEKYLKSSQAVCVPPLLNSRWSETQLLPTINTVSFKGSPYARLAFWHCDFPIAFLLEFILEKKTTVYDWKDKHQSHPLFQKCLWNFNFYLILFVMMGLQYTHIHTRFSSDKNALWRLEDVSHGVRKLRTYKCLEKAHVKKWHLW